MGANIFNSVMFPKIGSNNFDMSYDMKLSLNMGDLVPVHCQEIVPGDHISMSTESLLRFAPMLAPVMHKVDVSLHFFFVPNRLTWPSWENFITDHPSNPAHPYFAGLQVAKGSLADYLGLPIMAGLGIDKASALPFAAYHLIYNEFYRDQNLQPDEFQPLTDGVQQLASKDLLLRKRAWQHDYFTAALPFAQKGAPVSIPIGTFTDVPVEYNPAGTGPGLLTTQNGAPISSNNMVKIVAPVPGVSNTGNMTDSSNNPVEYNPNGTLTAKTSSLAAGSTTINDLRRAFKLQEWLERQARGGTRYIESILSHFGVNSSDARLSRPQYLGGTKQPVVISEVLQTSETVATPQGNMAGHAISVGGGKAFSFKAEEHGYIIGIVSVMPQTAYQQGIPRHFSKFQRLEYYWPSFAHLGEQEVKNREVFYSNDGQNDGTFGYVPRYSEYRYHDGRVAGDFRDTLSYWHLGRIFASRPALNANFVECRPTGRIFAVEDIDTYDSVYCHIFHRINARRKMPKYGTPEF